MSTNSILNADMATVGGWLLDGWRWWIQELADMVPASLQSVGGHKGPLALYREDGQVEILRGSVGTPERPNPANLAVTEALCLIRQIELPAMNLQDIKSTIALEANRLFPLSDDSLFTDTEIATYSDDRKTVRVRIAAIRREQLEAVISVANAIGVAPKRIGVQNALDPDRLHFDFAPQLRSLGVLPERKTAPMLWWGLVAALVMLNIGLLVWRDQQSVDKLQAAVEAQAPAVRVYRTIAARTARIDEITRTTSSRRSSHDALSDLAAVTVALPDSAWVQRYDWNGASLRIAGYLRPPTDLNAALGKSPRFTNVRASSADIQADIPIGQPYDVTADIKAGGQ